MARGNLVLSRNQLLEDEIWIILRPFGWSQRVGWAKNAYPKNIIIFDSFQKNWFRAYILHQELTFLEELLNLSSSGRRSDLAKFCSAKISKFFCEGSYVKIFWDIIPWPNLISYLQGNLISLRISWAPKMPFENLWALSCHILKFLQWGVNILYVWSEIIFHLFDQKKIILPVIWFSASWDILFWVFYL